MSDSTLQAIRVKTRRLTRSPSEAQLSTPDLDQYINTFVLYDFPEHVRLFSGRKSFTFYCNPFQDRYPTDTVSFAGVTTNPLYNFQNQYISVHPPLYIAGYQSFYTQSREQFFGIYPNTNNITSIGVSGDGTTTTFTGVINSSQAIIPTGLVQEISLLQNEVLFSSVDGNGSGLALIDVPVVDTITGNPSIIGNLYVPGTQPTTPPITVISNNTINYVTGVFTCTFNGAPANGAPINSQTVPQVPALPQAMLYYDNTFIVRPIPDQPYRINFEVYIRPTELLSSSQSPNLEEWWQYIAYGAAKKILEDRMDLDSVALIFPEFRKQETLLMRRTLVQYSNERVSTIYTEQTSFGSGTGPWGWGGGGF